MFTREVVFDLETDGLMDAVTRIHVLGIKDLSTGVTTAYSTQPGRPQLSEGLAILADPGTLVWAHNGTGYDCKVLKKLHGLSIPWYRQRDTMVLARLVWPELKQIDMDRRKKTAHKDFPGNLIGSHKLEAWGRRLGLLKGEYEGDTRIADEKLRKANKWAEWNQDMEDYCVLDVEVTTRLRERILAKEPSELSVLLETQVAHIVARQEDHGFLFNESKAVELYSRLGRRREELEFEVRSVFKPRFLRDGPVFTPAKDSKQYGYAAGAPLTKVRLAEFNPTSRDHVAYWLKLEYGWEPTEFTNDGKAKIDDEVIGKLPYAEAAPLKEYFMVVKRIGQIAEGTQGWLRKVKKDGRIHGRVNTNGAVTGRMTHMDPNMAQVPSGRAPYGHECRELFGVPVGKLLVGADADALELRDLAGFMAIYDSGAYIDTVLKGDKSVGTDMHSVNCRALGMDPKGQPFLAEGDDSSGRDIAKTWFYAFIYGAGDEKLGNILLRVKGLPAAEAGKRARAAFLKNLPAMGKLVAAVKERAKTRGFLLGLDKRHLPVRSQHAALNTLLQSAGAVQMKKALCLLDDSLQALGLVPGLHYEFVANVHDEWQIEVDHDKAELVAKAAVQAIRDSGAFFNFRCPLDGAYEIGTNWAETH